MIRKLIFQVHLYVGLVAGLLLVSAGLSGSVLVWKDEIDALLHPELLRVEPAGEQLPVEEVLAVVRGAFPERSPIRVQMPRAPEQSYEVTLGGESPLQVYVHPYRALVLGSRGEREGFANALFYWHTSLLSGETGERVMGAAALLLLVLLGTGVVVWWPGVRRLRDALVVRWSANWKRVNYDVHRAVGIWANALLALLAVTGASLVFHDAFMAGINRITASPPRPVPPPVVSVAGAPSLSVDSLIRAALRVVPGAQVTYVTLPAGPASALTVRLKQAPELHPNGRNFVYLHPQTGQVLRVENALTAPAGTRAYNILYPLHIGRWGGQASRVLYALAGLVPLVLFSSGVLMWRNRRRGKASRGRKQSRSAAASPRAAGRTGPQQSPVGRRRPASLP